MPSEDENCGPFTDPSSKDCTLPSGAKSASSAPPNVLAQDRAIEARYGKLTDDMGQMQPTGNKRGAGPGMI